MVEEVFATIDHAPVRNPADGAVAGVLTRATDTTGLVLAERRMRMLRELALRTAGAATAQDACERAAAVLSEDAVDLAFALIYLIDSGQRHGALAGTAGLEPGGVAAPRLVSIGAPDAERTWPLQLALAQPVLLDDLGARFPGGAAPARSALLLPVAAKGSVAAGVLVAGLRPRRPLDDDGRTFIDLVAQQLVAAITEARARQIERERIEQLADLDRTKTEFFANVSHEFRTPLTLLLTPLEEMLRQRSQLPAALVTEIDTAARNSRRLLRLVNNLLDFSEIETRRQLAPLALTDLCELTQDIASAFRSAIERAGLRFDVNCDPALPMIPVNREMWEKIVSNLLSNALKFTFEGAITLALRSLTLHAELTVTDSGVGIPQDELPNIFKRFHRVRGAKARTVEGSGMGLAIVHDLVARMGGQLTVRSQEGSGTSFTVWMPFKSARHSLKEAPVHAVPGSAQRVAADLANEAAAWTALGEPDGGTLEEPLGLPDPQQPRSLAPGARVLVADDNADMRDYLRRLLGAYWNVSVAADGAEALAAARNRKPDLILADVMMPRIDGFELLRAVREDESLKNVPMVFLTARAGEETAVEGLLAGADDYLAKPFSARELIARVGGQIMISRSRRRTEELNAFLIRYSDAVRGLADPQQIGRIACEMVRAELRVERAYWAEVDWSTREFVVQGGAWRAGVPVIEGRFPMDAWEPFADAHQRRSHVVHDARSDSRLTDAMRAGYAQLQIGADLASPVVVHDKLMSVLAVNQREPRVWKADEIALLESIAGRCWAEVERARGQAAAVEVYRRAEARQAFLLHLSDVLRAQPDEQSVKERALAMVADQFDPDRCYISEVFEAQGHSTVGPEHLRRGAAPMTGRYRLADYTEVMRQLATEPMVVHDADKDPRFSEEERKALARVPQRALLVAPLRNGPGAVIWALVVAMGTARTWTEEERLLLQDAAERTWTAIHRARAEAELRDSESRYLALFKTSPVPFLVLAPNPPDFTITAVNEAYLAATMTTRDSLIGRSMFDVFTDDTSRAGEHGSQALAASLRRVLETRRADAMARTRYDIAKPGGGFEVHWWNPINAPLLDAAGNVSAIIHHVMRVTELHLAEAAERKHRERQAFLLQLSDAVRPLADADAIRLAAAQLLGRYLGANRVAFSDNVGDESCEVFPNCLDGGAQVVGRPNEAGVAASRNVPLVKDGRLVAFIAVDYSSPHHFSPDEIELVTEVAERTWAAVEKARVEQALRVSEARQRSLFESIDEGFCTIEMIHDDQGRPVDYRFLEVNSAFERQTGLSNVVGRRMRELAIGHEQHWFDVYDRVATTGEPSRFEQRAEALHRWFSVYAFRVGEPRQRQVAILFDDITGRRLAQERLRLSEWRQTFLLKLSDALRPLADPVAVQAEACRVLGEHLGVDRAYYAEIDEGRGVVTVQRDYLRGDSPSMAGVYRLVDYGWSLPIMREERTIVFADVDAAPFVPVQDRPSLKKIDIVAHVAVPIVKGGILVGCFCVSEPVPREWREDEVELIRETGERTWVAVDLANALAALRARQ